MKLWPTATSGAGDALYCHVWSPPHGYGPEERHEERAEHAALHSGEAPRRRNFVEEGQVHQEVIQGGPIQSIQTNTTNLGVIRPVRPDV